MPIPNIAKFWTAILVLILLILVSGLIYVISSKPIPEPQPVTLEKHIGDLEIRAVGAIEKELDKIAK